MRHWTPRTAVSDICLTHLNLHPNCFVYTRYTSILSEAALWIIIFSVTVSTFFIFDIQLKVYEELLPLKVWWQTKNRSRTSTSWDRDVKTVPGLNAFDKKFVSTRCQKTNLGKSAKLVEKKRNEAGFNLTQGLRVVRWPLTRLLKRINQSWNYYPVALVQLYFILILILLKKLFYLH